MKTNCRRIAILPLFALIIVGGFELHAKEESRSVTASVSHGSGTMSGTGIRSHRNPGRFTVPKGHVATRFKYNMHDPKTDFTSTRLTGSSIYSETQGRYVSEADGNPDVQLPPGKYKFVVGGGPGSYGSLGFKVISTTVEPPTDQRDASNVNLPRNFDVTYNPMTDIYCSDEGSMKRMGDFEGIDYWNMPSQVVVRFRDGQVSSTWEMRHDGDGTVTSNTETMTGKFSNGRFTGTDTSKSSYHLPNLDGPKKWENGIVWSLTGQVDSRGLLILYGRWKSDYGKHIASVQDGNGKYKIVLEPYSLPAEIKAMRTEIHLRLPIQGKQTPSGPATPENPTSNPTNDWDHPDLTDPEDDTNTKPPEIENDRSESDNIWETDIDTKTDDVKDKVTHTDDIDDIDRDDEIDDRDEDQKRRDDGYRWDDRYGWINDDDDKRIKGIKDIQRRNDEKEKKRSDELADKLSRSKKKEREHAKQSKRAGDEALAIKVKALGWDSLTQKEKDRLGKADEDIKKDLRGDPKTIRGYKRGIIDNTMSQDAIDTTHKILQGTKVGIDETMGFLESKTGLPGKVISKTYTITSTIAGKVSKANADYNAGTTDKLDYKKAAVDGAKEGVTNVIVDEISGKLNEKVTDSLLNSKVGKKAGDYIESKANQAKKKATRDFMSGKSNSLNSQILDDVGEKAASGAKENINYAVGRASKPSYDATIGRPVKDAVDWSTGTEKPKQ